MVRILREFYFIHIRDSMEYIQSVFKIGLHIGLGYIDGLSDYP